MLGPNLDDAEEWVHSESSQVSDRTEAPAALADRVAALTASAASDDGAIRAIVASSGNLVGLDLTDDVQRMSGADLSAEILRMVHLAQAALVPRVTQAVEETVGAESEVGRAVLQSFAQRFPAGSGEPATPVMPAPPPFPSFQNRPTLPHQAPGNGFESGRDSRAR